MRTSRLWQWHAHAKGRAAVPARGHRRRGLARVSTSGLADKIAINAERVLDDLHTLRSFGAADVKYRNSRGGDGNPKGAELVPPPPLVQSLPRPVRRQERVSSPFMRTDGPRDAQPSAAAALLCS